MLKRSIISAFWKTKVDPNAPKSFVRIPQKKPYVVNLEAGRKYLWCSCGLSEKQPFCDQSHKAYNKKWNTKLKPVEFTVKKNKRHMLCGCKHTQNQPFCDFSHPGVIFRTAVGLEKEPIPCKIPNKEKH
ncbi:unnamed protein product [Phytomonas sp. Hart1]|nr:unnamed protein product [Phytomonas sp. Hart1]|eukprot:CCW71952.1 unnamed protein product [Phytomonas sp. isolate Hart1]